MQWILPVVLSLMRTSASVKQTEWERNSQRARLSEEGKQLDSEKAEEKQKNSWKSTIMQGGAGGASELKSRWCFHFFADRRRKKTHIVFMNSFHFVSFFPLSSPRCQCPPQFEGPECQQNKHSFHGNGYAWFHPIMPCFESHVTLEFITDVADGLLLYSGPLAQLQAWDHEDFMAIGRNNRKWLHNTTQKVLLHE